MKKQPLVSVIIPNYNYGRFLAECVQSVLEQTHKNIEIVVVDDGSSDGSAAVAAGFGDRVTLIVQENSGVGAARNRGAAEARGDFFAFLDADDLWFPKKVERQLEHLDGRPQSGFVTCGMEEIDLAGNVIRKMLEGQEGNCSKALLRHEEVVVGPGSTLMVERGLFETVGGFDTDREMHPAEDWEFSYRIAKKTAISFVPEALVRYRNHGGNGHLFVPKMERGLMLAYDKVFRNADAAELEIKDQCYGKAHSILAGMYFRVGEYPPFVKHAAKSIYRSPSIFGRYLTYPLRKLYRAAGRETAA